MPLLVILGIVLALLLLSLFLVVLWQKKRTDEILRESYDEQWKRGNEYVRRNKLYDR